MGTRGLFGFRYKGRYYLMYNHWDSYFSGLGVKLLQEIKDAIDNGTFTQWIELFKSVTIVDNNVDKENYLDTNEDCEDCEEEDYAKEDMVNKKEFYDKNNMKVIRRGPNQEDIKKLNNYIDLSVSSQSPSDWYCLLRKVQGSYKNILESQYLLLDCDIKSMTGNIFIEYTYILDFDSTNFHVYTPRGFYKTINLLDIGQINCALNNHFE